MEKILAESVEDEEEQVGFCFFGLSEDGEVEVNFCFFFGGGEETLLQLRSMWSLIKVSITLHWQIGHLTNCDVVIVVLRDDSSLLDFIR